MCSPPGHPEIGNKAVRTLLPETLSTLTYTKARSSVN